MKTGIVIFILCSFCSATTRYIASTAGTISGFGSCSGQTAITPATWNGITNSGGDVIWLADNFVGSAGATLFTVLGSGSSGNPITINFCTGASLSAPYWSGTNGAIDIHGLSYIVLDGKGTGTIQNTANGDGLANQHISIGVYGATCTNCTVKNITIANIYVAIQNYSSPLGGTATQMNAIYMSGSNWTLTGNTIHDCGWCVYILYNNGDTNFVVGDTTGTTPANQNYIYNWDHAVLFATPGTGCAAPCFFLAGNKFGSNLNWETSGCVYHLDGLHTYGVSGTTMNGVYIYNNWFTGTFSGACSSGFLFIEQGSPNQTNGSNFYVWNNVFDASQADGVNPNGWVGLFGIVGGVLDVYNNTLLCPSSTDGGTVGWALGNTANAGTYNFKGNVENKCPQGMNLRLGTGTLNSDYNAFGNDCNGTSNCWVYGTTGSQSFLGSFASWKSTTGGDSHSQRTTSDAGLGLGTNGAPNLGSAVILQSVNLGSVATGNLASLQNDTTLGSTRTYVTRPSSGTCSSQGSLPCWDEGAYEFQSATDSPSASAIGMFASLYP